jgi:hypothetical protein
MRVKYWQPTPHNTSLHPTKLTKPPRLHHTKLTKLAHTAPPSVSHAACNVSTAPLWQPTATLSPAQLTLLMGLGAWKKAYIVTQRSSYWVTM